MSSTPALQATVYSLIQLLDSMQGTKKGLTVTGTVLSDYIKAETVPSHRRTYLEITGYSK